MMRYFGAAVGFCAIAAGYCTATVIVLGSLVMAHCVLGEVQIEAGETCAQPADVFFFPTLIVAVVVFVGIQWAFLRWALRKRDCAR